LCFSAGVIHAYLAADRPAPAVVAGISSGAISAAAFQKAYRLKEQGKDREAARWAWFQKYAAALTEPPGGVFWDSLPNPTDFFADENLPGLRDFSLSPRLQTEQMHARRQRYLLQHLGLWCSKLSVRVSTIGGLIVNYVRYKESYSANAAIRFWNYFRFATIVVIQLLWHTAWHPIRVHEGLFDETKSGPRPLLGWHLYLTVLAVLFGACALVPGLALIITHLAPDAGMTLLAIFLVMAATAWAVRKREIQFLKKALLASVGFGRSLLHSFPLRKRIFDLFGDEPFLSDPMPALLVVAPLQTLYRDGTPVAARQLWARAGSQILTTEALVTAVAVPGIWEPRRITADFFSQWEPLPEMTPTPSTPARTASGGKQKGFSAIVESIRSAYGVLRSRTSEEAGSLNRDEPGPRRDVLDLVDGAAVRQNPLPAMLTYLKRNPDTAAKLEVPRSGAAIHVVYSVPLDPPEGDDEVDEQSVNIVDTALTALKLAARRDTSMEVKQLNCITRLERELRAAGKSSGATAAFADEIAPPAETARPAGNGTPQTDSTEKEKFKSMAVGCRRTLEKLYAGRLASMPAEDGLVKCRDLLIGIGTKRDIPNPRQPGLSEICSQCERKLHQPVTATRPPAGSLFTRFPNLKVRPQNTQARPRIVFLWSGGVFRGSFHIGMIAALRTANVRPDLIAGASVGTLMGATLASIFSLPEDEGTERFKRLVAVFRQVDSEVALTKTLKEASRDLGIRARNIRLSPAMVRQTVLQGIRADSGYAATGAPPELIDAIASLFSIPLDETREIAGRFIAGMVAEATRELLISIRKHTLMRLNIQSAVIGSSLLEKRAAELIGGTDGTDIPLNTDQPFTEKQIAFLATATNLGAQGQVVFGDNPGHRNRRYDFVASTLSSSAFPAVFAPRRQSDVLPGYGHFNVRYSDGGIFDNLPFLPAIQALAHVQREETKDMDDAALHQYVIDRNDNPDLFLAGALDARSETAEDGDGPFDYFDEISARSKRLKDNSKIHSFVNAAHVGSRQLGELAGTNEAASFQDRNFVRAYVHSAVLPVFPSDAEHLNPTFAFCRSTGMKPARLASSIADGCFQTFQTLADARDYGSDSVRKSLDRVYDSRPAIKQITSLALPVPGGNPGTCPFFHLAGKSFDCPFIGIDAKDIHTECRKRPRGTA